MNDERRRTAWVCVLLVALTLGAFGPVWRLGFIDFDDPLYVTENASVLAGLSPAGCVWAFRTTDAANWHPLTWLSLMLDASLGGANPRIYHATNLALHAANALLLFLVLFSMTGCRMRSAVVAALFAVHPLHVESVAWIAERKDVLSTLFWFLTIGAYARYAARPSLSRYTAVVVALALGLMAKPMLVSLPLVLLLLDVWPLARAGAVPWRTLLLEKVPLGALAMLSALVTLIVQKPAMQALAGVGFRDRAANAALSYVGYVGAMLWPARLSVFYPFPRGGIPLAAAGGAAIVLAAVSVAVLPSARSRPWLPVGWFWYVITLVPVAGLVQIGSQARADRYTYVPLVGLFVMAAWSVPLFAERAAVRALARAGTAAVVVALSAATWIQVGTWRSNLDLFTHAAAATGDNAFAQFKIAEAEEQRGNADAAVAHLREALRIEPAYAKAHFNLTGILARQRKTEEVAASCREEVALWPNDENTLIDLGVLAFLQGNRDAAAARFTEALRVNPDSAAARHNLEVIGSETPERTPSAGPRPSSVEPR
jgi:predicted negative regulator of RcsB-dependent stress response